MKNSVTMTEHVAKGLSETVTICSWDHISPAKRKCPARTTVAIAAFMSGRSAGLSASRWLQDSSRGSFACG